jgi:ribosome-associated protein
VTAGAHDDGEDDGGAERPSKSARKRAAQAAQDLGEALLRLPEAELAAIELPEGLREALRAGRRINSRAAAVRQRQYIGKLMRKVDLEPIRTALAARAARDARDTELFRRTENWRDRLISEGEPALAELVHWHPALDLSEWRQRVEAARAERAHSGSGGSASRELFRALRALFATMSR